MTAFTARELHREASREVGYRRRVYLRMVVEGRMKGDDADRRIAMMEEIAAKLAEEAEVEEARGRLL